MDFLSNIIKDAKPQAPLPMRVALGASLSTTTDASVIVAGTETSPGESAWQVGSQNIAERPAMPIPEFDSTRSRSRDVSISGFQQSPVRAEQPLPLYHQPPIPKQDEANEQPVSPMPGVDTSDNANISIANDDRERPPTESSERSTPHRQMNNMPTGASAPAPSIIDNDSGDGAQAFMMEESVSDAVTQSSKPHAHTLSDQSPPLEQTQQASNRQRAGEVSRPLGQTRKTSTQPHDIDPPRTETPVAQSWHHPAPASTPSIPSLTMDEAVSSERALPQSTSSPVSRTDSASSGMPLTTLKPLEAASQQVQVTPWGASYPPPPERKPEPTVQIGQVDILVSAPETTRPQMASRSKPHNIASRRYLRRL